MFTLREGDVPCTSNEIPRLRNNWPEGQLKLYYVTRWNIPFRQYDTYNWKVFESTNKKLSESEKRYVVKLLTRWLPVGHNLNKYSTVTHACPFCHHNETVYHLFQCPQNPSTQDTFLNKLDKHLQKTGTDQFLQILIMNTFREGFQTPILPGESTPHWYIACAGLLPKAWTETHTMHMEPVQAHNEATKHKKWSAQLSYWLIQNSHQIWQTRNNKLHNSKQQDMTQSQLHKHVTELYLQQHQLLPTDQKMFHLPLEQRLQQPFHTLQQWFRQTYDTTQRCIQHSKMLVNQGQTDIRKFFSQFTQSNNQK